MSKSIQFFDLSRQYKKYKSDINLVLKKVLEKQAFIGGNFVENFEKKFALYLQTTHAISCNSGTDALWMALKALELKKNEIVLTTPFSFIASSSEIVSHGGHPVFIDIETHTYNIDPIKIEEWIKQKCDSNLIHKKTGYKVVGILPVDIFGQCANYEKIRKIAKQYNLWIVQDACQAVGSYDSSKVYAGNHGDIACFSFYPTKNLGGYGDGGCCTTNNPHLAKKLMRIRNHGRTTHYNYIEPGVNSRLDGIQAAILNEKLKYLDKFNSKRKEIAAIYNKVLDNIPTIELPISKNGNHVYHQYCIKLLGINRENLIQELKNKRIGTNVYYPKGLNQINFLNTDGRLKNECPISDSLTQNILALPIWPELEIEEVRFIAEQVKTIVTKISSQEKYTEKQLI